MPGFFSCGRSFGKAVDELATIQGADGGRRTILSRLVMECDDEKIEFGTVTVAGRVWHKRLTLTCSPLFYLYFTMRVATWLSSVLFAAVVLAADPPTELQILTTFLPEECPTKAAKGDSIKVHYVTSSSLRCHSATNPAIDRYPLLQRQQVRLQVCSPIYSRMNNTSYARYSLDRGQPLPLTRTWHTFLYF